MSLIELYSLLDELGLEYLPYHDYKIYIVQVSFSEKEQLNEFCRESDEFVFTEEIKWSEVKPWERLYYPDYTPHMTYEGSLYYVNWKNPRKFTDLYSCLNYLGVKYIDGFSKVYFPSLDLLQKRRLEDFCEDNHFLFDEEDVLDCQEECNDKYYYILKEIK